MPRPAARCLWTVGHFCSSRAAKGGAQHGAGTKNDSTRHAPARASARRRLHALQARRLARNAPFRQAQRAVGRERLCRRAAAHVQVGHGRPPQPPRPTCGGISGSPASRRRGGSRARPPPSAPKGRRAHAVICRPRRPGLQRRAACRPPADVGGDRLPQDPIDGKDGGRERGVRQAQGRHAKVQGAHDGAPRRAARPPAPAVRRTADGMERAGCVPDMLAFVSGLVIAVRILSMDAGLARQTQRRPSTRKGGGSLRPCRRTAGRQGPSTGRSAASPKRPAGTS